MILDLFAAHHTLTAQEIRARIQTLDESTIYRNLERFVADGILKKVATQPGVVSFEKTNNTHDHFVCQECEAVLEFRARKDDILLSLPKGTRVAQGGVVVYGQCEDCGTLASHGNATHHKTYT